MRAKAWLTAAVVALAGVVFLAVFPARAYLSQYQQRRDVASRVKTLSAQNQKLEERARLLETDAEVERLARERFHLVRPGEEAFAILPSPKPPPPPPPPPPSDDRSWWQKAWHVATSVF